MKNKIIYLLTTLLFLSNFIYAQGNVHQWIKGSTFDYQVINLKPENINDITSRTLIVELLEFDERHLDLYKHNNKSETEIQYKKFIENYNSYIKSAVKNNWTINNKIIYKTTSELSLLKETSSEFSVLWYSAAVTSPKYIKSDIGFNYNPKLSIPTLNYSRIENGWRSKKNNTYIDYANLDFCFFMPYYNRVVNEIKESDLIISLNLIQNHINEIKKKKSKSYNKMNAGYYKARAKENINQLENNDVYIIESLISEYSSLEEMQSYYTLGTLKSISEEELTKLITAKENKIIAFLMPFSNSPQGIIDGVWTSQKRIIIYKQVFINIKTGEICGYGQQTSQFNYSTKMCKPIKL